MDTETKEIISNEKLISEIINHQGWKLVRERFIESILDLQNAFNLDDSDAQKFLIDVKARKIATTLLYDFLKQIEGSTEVVNDNFNTKDTHIVRLD